MWIVVELGVVGELEFICSWAQAAQSEEVGGEIFTCDRNMSLDVVTKIFAEDWIGVKSCEEAKKGEEDKFHNLR